MIKETLIVIGLALIIMGAWGLVPGSTLGTEPQWHAILKIVIGLIGIGVAISEKKSI
jgi:hypothetical protein